MALYKRPGSKYYWMKFRFDGELVQRSTKVSNKKDAAIVEAAFRTQLALGKIGIKPKPKAPTFKQAVEAYLEWSKLNHAAKPRSHWRVSYACQPLLTFFGETRADRITAKDVEKFLLWRTAQKSRKTGKVVTGDTVSRELIALKTIFKRLAAENVLTENPAVSVKLLAKNERKFYVVNRAEEHCFLMASEQPLQDVAALMLETGMRPSEIYPLRRSQVNLEQRFVQVENSKTRSSNRKVWLSEKAYKILLGRVERFKGEYLFPKGETDGSPPIYALNIQHQAALGRTGLKFRLYDLRHTFATRQLENGIDLVTLAAMLGHANLSELMRYCHPSEDRKKEAIQQMQKRVVKS